jgi:hypothetical protein
MKKTIAFFSAVMFCSVGHAENFICHLKNNKTLTIGVNDTGTPVYQYGTVDHTDLRLPVEHKDIDSIRNAYLLAPGGGEVSYLRFINGTYSYVVFTSKNAAQKVQSGVAIWKASNLVSILKCTNETKPIESYLGNAQVLTSDDDDTLYGYKYIKKYLPE